jgi:hypothetical protein
VLRDDELRWLRLFADHAAVTIANSKAFAEVERLRRDLELENISLRDELSSAVPRAEIVGSCRARLYGRHALAQSIRFSGGTLDARPTPGRSSGIERSGAVARLLIYLLTPSQGPSIRWCCNFARFLHVLLAAVEVRARLLVGKTQQCFAHFERHTIGRHGP